MTERFKLDGKLKEAYETMSFLAVNAYRDIYLLSNEVLSKNPLTNNYLSHFLAGFRPPQTSVKVIIFKILRYYKSSFFHYIAYLGKYSAFLMSGLKRYKPSKKNEEIVLIDTFFLVEEIIKTGTFIDSYFNGLADVLIDKNREYAYIPVFYGSRNFLSFKKALKIIQHDGAPVLSEYQLLTLADLFQIITFILTYPWHVLKFAKTLDIDDGKQGLVYYELLDSLDQVTFPHFSRYLQGRRIADLPFKIKLISWYENQVIDKNLYRGIRAGAGKVSIYGAQLFLYSTVDLNIIPDENEVPLQVVPDKIIVNGFFYAIASSRINYGIGPSLRYKKLFLCTTRHGQSSQIIIALLSYNKEENENLLKLLLETEKPGWKIIIKPHPATPIEQFRNLLRSEWKITEESIYNLFASARIVVGSASGSLIEAMCSGLPVIDVKYANRGFHYYILPESARGLLWDRAESANEIGDLIEKFSKALDENGEEMKKAAMKYRDIFFCEPTVNNISKAFDL